MNKATRAILTGAGAAVAGIAAMGTAAYASTKYLVRVAIDRQQPKVGKMEKTREKLRGYADSGDFFSTMEIAGHKLKNAPHQTVHIQSHDGHTLAGHWFTCKEPKRIIVAMHGWRSRWYSDFGTVAEFWRKNGCCVLYAEQRGQGSSGGAYMGFGVMERHDCAQWVKWVNTQFEKELPVYLAGVSMGATTVLMASELELPKNVRGIMADCGFTSPDEIFRHVAEKNLHLSYDFHINTADKLFRQKLQTGTKDCSTVNILKNCRIPVLLAHGTEDHFVPVEMTYKNYKACAAPKRLLIVPGADHGMSYYTEKDRYEKAVLDFFRDFDD